MKKEAKAAFYELLDSLTDLSVAERLTFIRKLLINYQKDREEFLDTSNKGKPWTDTELELILSSAPTKENCAYFARIFRRGYGSIEQIYRWAATPDSVIQSKGRANDAFVKQVKSIAKRIGFRA